MASVKVLVLVCVLITVHGQAYNGNRNQQGTPPHCLRTNVLMDCVEGPSRRVYNTGEGEYWDPEYEEVMDLGNGWSCTSCCTNTGTTLPVCNGNSVSTN